MLGNLDSKRDWGYAGDYVKAMWMMLQQDEPDDYVIATGETHTMREFLERGVRRGRASTTGSSTCSQDPTFFRPAEVDLLIGDATKAHEKLGWKPEVDFPELVQRMVAHDLAVETRKAERR